MKLLALLLSCLPAAAECVTYNLTALPHNDRTLAHGQIITRLYQQHSYAGGVTRTAPDWTFCAGLPANQFPTQIQLVAAVQNKVAADNAANAADDAAHQAYEDAVAGSPVCMATAAQVDAFYENARSQLAGATQSQRNNWVIDDAKRQALCFVWLRNRMRQE